MELDARAYLVESIPVGLEALRQTEGVAYTETVLKRLTDGAVHSIDLMAMYWNLLPDGADADEEGFSEVQFREMGADHGRLLLQALAEAARRGVMVRVVQSPGFRPGPHESDWLAQQFPELVQVRQPNMKAWYGDGIMHQKMWIFDRRHIYLGSANMDWKSLTQVKELGIVVEDELRLAEDVTRQFEAWWRFCALQPAPVQVEDPYAQTRRTVPGWSALVPEIDRIPSPLERSELNAQFNLANPLVAPLNGQTGECFFTSSPPECCPPGRTDDLEGLLYTIRSAQREVCISVMNFSPLGLQYNWSEAAAPGDLPEDKRTVWWPALIDALLTASVTRGIQVRLLVSHWAYSSETAVQLLQTLKQMVLACSSNGADHGPNLAIKLFHVPGWDDVNGPERAFPGHSRVNHPKYVVTDQRVHIGTSNMTWRYFVNNAGASLNSTHTDLVQKLQEIFDRDWESPYALDLV